MIKCTSCGHENPDYCIYCQECNSLLSSITPDGEIKEINEINEIKKTDNQFPEVKKEAEPQAIKTPEASAEINSQPPVEGTNIPKEVYSPDSGEYKYTGPEPTEGKSKGAIIAEFVIAGVIAIAVITLILLAIKG